MDVKAICDDIEENGFHFFRGFATTAEIDQARNDLESWYQKDLSERKEKNITEAHYDSVAGHSILTEPSHLLIDVYGRSKTLDTVVERILTDPITSEVLKYWVGENYDFYGYNIRRMTGSYNPHPAHEFHRDSKGEFGIGILLSDIDEGKDAATALVPKSHYYPYDPRLEAALSYPVHGMDALPKSFYDKFFMLNKMLGKKIVEQQSGGFGKRGDIYFFINDVWHGRQPNLNGKESMVMLIGGAPSHVKLHHPVNFPPEQLLKDLPPTVKWAYCERNKPQKPDDDIIMSRFVKRRDQTKTHYLFRAAKLECQFYRKVANCINFLKRVRSRIIADV